MKSLFIYNPVDLNAEVPGGVQLCTQEFLKIIESASDTIEYCEVKVSRRLSWRLRRRFHLGSYLFYHPEEARDAIISSLQRTTPTHVFLNRTQLVRLTPLLRQLLPEAQIIMMNLGNQSGDDLYELAGPGGRRTKGLSRLSALWQFGLDVGTESWFRHRYVDAICVMSVEEEAIERWLGTKRTVILPRTVQVESLPRNPQIGRIGFVGTLNHTPNCVALDLVCSVLSQLINSLDYPIELRLVGRPETFGQNLAERFKFVTYLGALDESALKEEVSTWVLFLNPIFWLSCGASMKLGKAISWGIPFLTTQSGSRGYELVDAAVLTTPDDPQSFVSQLLTLVSSKVALDEAQRIVDLNQRHGCTIENLSQRLSSRLAR